MSTPKIKKKIPEDKYFKLCNGKILKDLKDLAEAFSTMPYEVFHHHATPNRNDFANWIKDIFSEKELATEIHLTHNSKDAELKVLRHLVKKLY